LNIFEVNPGAENDSYGKFRMRSRNTIVSSHAFNLSQKEAHTLHTELIRTNEKNVEQVTASER